MSQSSESSFASAKTSREVRIQSQLVELFRTAPMLRGTLNKRSNTCGKQNCRCVGGDGHPALYLVLRKPDGSYDQIYVAKRRQREITQAVENFQRAQELLNELSSLTWKRLKER